MGQSQPMGKRELNDYINLAIQLSPLIKDYGNQLLMNRIDSMSLKAGFKPQVTASSTGLYAPVIKGYGYDQVLTNGQSLEALLTVNYALIGNGKKKNQNESLNIQRDSIRYATKLSELDLKKVITDQYINAFASQQQVVFNYEIYQLLQKEEAVLKLLTRENSYRQTDYLTFLVAYKQQQLTWKQAELQFKNDLYTLNYFSGLTDTSNVSLAEPMVQVNTIVKPEKSFFETRFEIDSLKVQNEKKALEFNYKPKASVYINGGYNSSFLLQPYKNFGSSVGFTVSIPIYDGHQKKMMYNKLSLQEQTTSTYKEFFINQQNQQVLMLEQQLSATEELFLQINEQIKYTKALIEADSKLLHSGDVKVADFVIAINNYMSAQNLYRLTNINRLKLISQFNYWKR